MLNMHRPICNYVIIIVVLLKIGLIFALFAMVTGQSYNWPNGINGNSFLA